MASTISTFVMALILLSPKPSCLSLNPKPEIRKNVRASGAGRKGFELLTPNALHLTNRKWGLSSQFGLKDFPQPGDDLLVILVHFIVCQGPVIGLIPDAIGEALLPLRNRRPLIDIEEIGFVDKRLREHPDVL